MIQINPHDHDTHANKGNALSALNRKEEVIECYDKAIQINPNSLKA